jgi:hypothetical protein
LIDYIYVYIGDIIIPLSTPPTSTWIPLRPLWVKNSTAEVSGDIQLSFHFTSSPSEEAHKVLSVYFIF